MKLKENYRRHMYIKTSPMQDLPIYCYRYGHLENVQALIVTVPPTKVLSAPVSSNDSPGRADSLRGTGVFCTHAFFKMQENAFGGLKEKRYAKGL